MISSLSTNHYYGIVLTCRSNCWNGHVQWHIIKNEQFSICETLKKRHQLAKVGTFLKLELEAYLLAKQSTIVESAFQKNRSLNPYKWTFPRILTQITSFTEPCLIIQLTYTYWLENKWVDSFLRIDNSSHKKIQTFLVQSLVCGSVNIPSN